MHCMLMDLLHGFEVLSTTEETLFNSRNVSRLVQNEMLDFTLVPKLLGFFQWNYSRELALLRVFFFFWGGGKW